MIKLDVPVTFFDPGLNERPGLFNAVLITFVWDAVNAEVILDGSKKNGHLGTAEA
jgi:hypothetical protein